MKKAKALAKTAIEITGYDGEKVIVYVDTNQKWNLRKNGNYYFLSRKGTALRLTERRFAQIFSVEEVSG